MSARQLKVGNYQIGERLGEGTFGTVVKATHAIAGERVAVKVLEKKRMQQADDIERVGREIQILKLLKHPYVIRLWEIIYEKDKIYLSMEFAAKGELFQHIVKHRRCREPEARRFFVQIMSGVAYLHAQHVVHRDIKPENLLLDEQRNIRIADFGLSTRCAPGQVLRHSCGSPCYAAPEMLTTHGQQHGYVGHPVDVWSCGVTLFAMVCGFLPFEHTSTNVLYKKIIAGAYVSPPHLSRECKDVMRRLLTTEPKKRWEIPQILAHPWCTDGGREPVDPNPIAADGRGAAPGPADPRLLQQLELHGIDASTTAQEVADSKHSPGTAAYHLLAQRERKAGKLAEQPAAAPNAPKVPDFGAATAAAVATIRVPLSERSVQHNQAPPARKALSARDAREHGAGAVAARSSGGNGANATARESTGGSRGYGYAAAHTKENACYAHPSPRKEGGGYGLSPRKQSPSSRVDTNYNPPRLKRSPAPKAAVRNPAVPTSSPELPSPLPAPRAGVAEPVGAGHAAVRAALTKGAAAAAAEADVSHQMLLQMHAAHRRRALAEQQAARAAWRPGTAGSTPRSKPLSDPAAVPRPPPRKAALSARGAGTALAPTYATRGGAPAHPSPRQDAAQDGLGRRVAGGATAGPPAHAKHGADLRARKYAAASAARDAGRPPAAYAARVAAWAR